MLSNYAEDEVVEHYINELKGIDAKYSSFDPGIKEELDPESAKGKKVIDKALMEIGEISKLINDLRLEIIE
jgi:hypothetical protein